MKEDRIRNWDQLNAALFEDSWYSPHGRFRGPFLFRGMTNASWNLETSLMRLGGHYPDVESSLLRNFRKYAHRDSAHGDSFWHWMAVAQHHGLPTRLLDWTFSPHVAAHFATDDFNDAAVDGVVWAVNVIRLQDLLPAKMRKVLRQQEAFIFTTAMLDRFASSLGEFDNMLKKEQPVVLFLEPPSLDDRIVNQASLLSFMSPVTVRLDQWLADRCPHLARKIIIPASVKSEIRDKLDMMNLTERMMFPGPDGLSKWLKRYYSPLNLIEVTYENASIGGETKIGVIEKAENGVLWVRLFTAHAESGEARLQSQDDGHWYDTQLQHKVTVKPRATPARCEAALAHLAALRGGSWLQRRQQADALRKAWKAGHNP